jgi:hypothetical protein
MAVGMATDRGDTWRMWDRVAPLLLLLQVATPALVRGDAAEPDARDEENDDLARGRRLYACRSLVELLHRDVDASEKHPLRLAEHPVPDGEASCDDYRKVAGMLDAGEASGAESGTLGGHRAVARSDGPHGSGHFWDVQLAVVRDGGQKIGACLLTSTTGWRNVGHDSAAGFGPWRMLVKDRFVLWSTLVVGAAEYDSLLLPLVYRLEGSTLVLDSAATLAEIRRFGSVFARLHDRAVVERVMHRGAAAAYSAFGAGSACRTRRR